MGTWKLAAGRSSSAGGSVSHHRVGQKQDLGAKINSKGRPGIGHVVVLKARHPAWLLRSLLATYEMSAHTEIPDAAGTAVRAFYTEAALVPKGEKKAWTQ